MKLKILFFCLLLAFFSVKNVLASTAYYQESLPKWLEMLKSGDAREKKLALNNLWFLEYQEFRKDKNVFDPILEALKDKDASVRAAAVACLKVIGREIPFAVSTTIVPSLIKVLNEDENPRVRAEAAKALGMYRFDRKDQSLIDMAERVIDSLINALKDKDPWVRLNATFSLGELGARQAREPLGALLEDNSDWRKKFIQQECLIALRKIGFHTEIDKGKLQSVLRNKFEDKYLKAEVIKTLGYFRFDESSDLLMIAAEDSAEVVRKLSIEAMSKMPSYGLPRKRTDQFQRDKIIMVDDPRVNVCIKALADSAVSVRLQAIAALSIIKDNRPVDPLINALKDKNGEVRRNAMIALGNFSDEKILDVSIKHFGEEQYNYQDVAVKSFLSVAGKTCKKRLYVYKKDGVRGLAANDWSFPPKVFGGQLMVHPLAVEKLLNAFNKRHDTDQAILAALSCFEDERIFSMVTKDIDKRPTWFKKETMAIIRFSDNDKAFPLLIKMLKDQDKRIRIESITLLGQIRDKRTVQPLLDLLNDKDDDLRVSAISAIKKFDEPIALDLCYPLLRDKSKDVRHAAALYITEKPDKKSVKYLIYILESFHETLALQAADALSVMKDERAVEPLIKALKRPPESNRNDGFESGLRLHAATALGKIGNKKAVPALIECLSNEKNDKYLRQHAAKALKHIDDPIALKAIAAVPEDWLHEIGSAKKVTVPPKRKLPTNIPGYPNFGLD